MNDQEDQAPAERRRLGLLNRSRRTITKHDGKKVTMDPDIFMIGLALGLVLLGSLVALTLWQQSALHHQQDQIEANQNEINANQKTLRHQQQMLIMLERRDRVSSYQAAYRFCTRESIDRAAVHWFLSRRVIVDLPAKVVEQARRQSRSDLLRMERKDGMPILDCNPNTVGDPASYLPPVKQRKFVERWRKHQLTPAEIGICKIRIGEAKRPGECLK